MIQADPSRYFFCRNIKHPCNKHDTFRVFNIKQTDQLEFATSERNNPLSLGLQGELRVRI